MDQGTRRGCRLVARRIAVIAGALLISWGLARLCLESWSAVDHAPAPTLDLLLGAVAATGACAVVGWWALVVTPVPVLPVYVRMAKERGAGLTELQKLHLWAHFRFRQPRDLLGLAGNTEPEEFIWEAILWLPTSRRWAGTAGC